MSDLIMWALKNDPLYYETALEYFGVSHAYVARNGITALEQRLINDRNRRLFFCPNCATAIIKTKEDFYQ